MPDYYLVNGEATDRISIRDRGLAYGDGVFETLRVVTGVPQFLELHIARLERGCRRLHIRLDRERLIREIGQLLHGCGEEPAVLKITVTRDSPLRGYRYHKPAPGNRYLLLQSAAANLERLQSGVRLRLCRHRLPVNPALAGIKHLNRLDNVIARAEWDDASIDEGLMLDGQGRVVEGTMSNLFLVSGRRLVTPAVHRCGVAGVVRQVIIEKLSLQLGVDVEIGDVLLEDLYRAPEVFICNSLIGICPVLAIDCQAKSPGEITLALQKALGEAV